MKNILKLLFLSLLVMSYSCDNQDMDLLTVNTVASGEITAPAQGSSYVLNFEENQLNPAFTLTWNPADYGIPTQINYSVEFAKSGTDFAEPYLAGKTTNTYMTWSITEFNGAVVTAGLSPFVEGNLDIRVISTVGEVGSTPQTSSTLTVLVTPFTTDLPKIAVPGNHQGWDPATAQLLAASAFGETDYEGYVWLKGGVDTDNGDGFKFLAPDQTGGFFWGNIDWGDDGSYTGKLVVDNEKNCTVTDDGFYFVKADTNALTYSTTLESWGIIGGSIPGTGWGEDVDMTYDPATRTLKITLDLVNPDSDAGIKFRANNSWTKNLGDNGADGSLEQDGANIQVPSDGNYTVTLDLSHPREYTYSLVKN